MPSMSAEFISSDSCFLEGLYHKYRTLLYVVARKYVDGKDCEDVVQDAVVRLAQNVGTLRQLEEKPLITYLSLSVRSAALNYREHQKVVDLHSSDLSVEEAYRQIGQERLTNGLDAALLQRERVDAVFKALKRIPERDQILLLGKYYLGLSNQELQEMVGCKVSSIRMMLTRAKRALIAELEKGDFMNG